MVEPQGAICIAAYRPSWDLFVEQLRSIQQQSLSNWVAIIGIDGRDENLKVVLEEFLRGDDRFRVRHYEERVGHYRNFERLLGEVAPESQWIALADQDDRWYPEKLERLVPCLRDHDLVCSQARIVSVDGASRSVLGTTSRSNASLGALLINNRVTGSFSILSPRLVRAALPFPAATDQAFHDHWLGVCARATDRLTFIDDVLQDYHQHGSNVIGEETEDSFLTRLMRLRVQAHTANADGALAYVMQHRWAWRANMARTLVRRETVSEGNLRVAEAFAQNRLSLRLLRIVISEVFRRAVPALRAFVLLVGAAAAKRGGKV